MKIFVDFDDTLFNTKKFKDDLRGIFLKKGVSKKEFNDTYVDYPEKWEGGFITYDPKKQIERLSKIKGAKLDIESDINDLMSDLSGYVFEDVHRFIDYFDKKDLFLVSFGKCDFQERKVGGAGVGEFFSRIKVSNKEKIEFIKNVLGEGSENEKIFFIDDRSEQLLAAKNEIKNVILIRIKRKESRYKNLPDDESFAVVKGLDEAKDVILKNI